MLKNNKGFSLIEILVTVGLIGILVGIAVPSYRNYKENTVKMAMRAEVGNGQKAYGAKYAIDSSYCHSLAEVGMDTDRTSSPIFQNKGFFGFGAGISISGNACTLTPVENFQFISKGDAKCTGSSATGSETQTACTGSGKTWTIKADTQGKNAPGCELGTNTFIIGAYSDVSSLNTLIQANEQGQVFERSAEEDCKASCFGDPTCP